MLKEITKKEFTNGVVYLLETEDGYPIETTDTFLPFYTKDAIGRKQNALADSNIGSRKERWMIGVSTMSGCPVKCKFCAASKQKKWRRLTGREIVDQIMFILSKHRGIHDPKDSEEFKINYTRMGEPFLNLDPTKYAIQTISMSYPDTHHYLSTIGIEGSDFSFIKDNLTLQFSIHSFDEEYRDWLIPYPKKMSLKSIGQVRTNSNLKTTLNLTLVREEDFDIEELKKNFDSESFFVKLSPINPNCISEENQLGLGIIEAKNLQ